MQRQRISMAIDPHIACQFEATAYCEHNIVVYSDLHAFRELYCQCTKRALERDNEIVLLATHYEEIKTVRSALQNYDINVKKHEEDGSLVIIDSVKAYQQHAGENDYSGVYKLAQSLAVRARKEGEGGVFGLSDMGSFFLFKREQALVEYELSIPRTVDVPLKGFCCYHSTDFFGRLAEQQMEALVNHHNRSIRV